MEHFDRRVICVYGYSGRANVVVAHALIEVLYIRVV